MYSFREHRLSGFLFFLDCRTVMTEDVYVRRWSDTVGIEPTTSRSFLMTWSGERKKGRAKI